MTDAVAADCRDTNGVDAERTLPAGAAGLLGALEHVIAGAQRAVDPELYSQTRARIASALGFAAPVRRAGDDVRLDFAEQFAVDVSSITVDQRVALSSELGTALRRTRERSTRSTSSSECGRRCESCSDTI